MAGRRYIPEKFSIETVNKEPPKLKPHVKLEVVIIEYNMLTLSQNPFPNITTTSSASQTLPVSILQLVRLSRDIFSPLWNSIFHQQL
jgi:hypothetical protein